MSALAEIDGLAENERGWRERVLSLVITGRGVSDGLSPHFPAALPPGLPVRLGSVCFRMNWCVLSFFVETNGPGALLAEQRQLLLQSGWALAVDEIGRIHATPPTPGQTTSIEIELLPTGLRVVWWLEEARMGWLMNDDGITEHARVARLGRRQRIPR